LTARSGRLEETLKKPDRLLAHDYNRKRNHPDRPTKEEEENEADAPGDSRLGLLSCAVPKGGPAFEMSGPATAHPSPVWLDENGSKPPDSWPVGNSSYIGETAKGGSFRWRPVAGRSIPLPSTVPTGGRFLWRHCFVYAESGRLAKELDCRGERLRIPGWNLAHGLIRNRERRFRRNHHEETKE